MTAQWAFIEHVTDSLGKSRQGDPKAPTLWPSEASALVTIDGKTKVVGKCRRATFFRYLLENFKFFDKYHMWKPLIEDIQCNALATDKYLLWIWRQGELYEEFLVEQAKIAGVFMGGQIPVYIKDCNLSGKEDLTIINPISHKLSIVEAKSVYGHGANVVLGTPGARKKGDLGTPRDSNLMQIALYHWWHASEDTAFEESRLVYGARDTGRYAEYLVKTETQEDGTINILYKCNAPNQGPWITSPITINAILREYHNQQLWLDGGIIPERDFDLIYSEDQLAALYAADELGKVDKEKYEKVIARKEENELRVLAGKKPKQELKQIEKGDWHCNYCQYRNICYDKENKPRAL